MIVSWNWLKEYLGETELNAEKAAELIGAHAFEVESVEKWEDDFLLDIDVLPNRSSDCLCHRGIARELSSITNSPLQNDPLTTAPVLVDTKEITVSIQDENDCPRFTAALITGIKVTESPAWLKKRLEAIGQRSINNIVDATNYVMFAIGQPLHAYDADLFPKVDGAWQFEVRRAKEGEKVSLIAEGGKDEDRIVECRGTELLIVDKSSDTPIGLAGVKGGRFAGVHKGTTNVIIEAAHFNPTLTRQTARRLGIVIDASKRFENEPALELPLYAQAEIIKLIADIAGGDFKGVVDVYPKPLSPVVTEVSPDRCNALLGLDISVEEIKKLIERTGAKVESSSDNTFVCTSPWERTDLNIEEDYIEEVGRLFGYHHVEAVLPTNTDTLIEFNQRHIYSEKIRSILLGLGCSEVITSSFQKKDKLQLRNALASDKGYLRSTLTGNLAEALDKNAGFVDLLGLQDIRIFEIGTVFYPTESSVSEHVSLAIGVRTKKSGYVPNDEKLLDQIVAELSKAFEADLQFTRDKGIAELNVTNLITTLPEIQHYEPVNVAQELVYKPFSTFQHMSRDIAMWVDIDTNISEIERVIKENAGELCRRITLVDEFTKDGRTSYAFRLVFQSYERTLTDMEVNAVMEQIYSAAKEKNWEVR